MLWKEIKKQYPHHFVLLENPIEEKIAPQQVRILGGEVLEVSEDGTEIRQAYRTARKSGKNVFYSIPNTPEEEFVIEVAYFRGVLLSIPSWLPITKEQFIPTENRLNVRKLHCYIKVGCYQFRFFCPEKSLRSQ